MGSASADGNFQLFVDGTIAMNIDDDTQDISVSTGNLIIPTADKGISFTGGTDPDTAGSATGNILDDYEEGTFEPVLSDGSNNATMHASSNGYYTKIGDMVHCDMYVLVTSLGSVSGNIRVTGLPFVQGGGTGQLSSLAVGIGQGMSITAGTTVAGYLSAGISYIFLHHWDVTAGTSHMQASEWAANGEAIISVTYKA